MWAARTPATILDAPGEGVKLILGSVLLVNFGTMRAPCPSTCVLWPSCGAAPAGTALVLSARSSP